MSNVYTDIVLSPSFSAAAPLLEWGRPERPSELPYSLGSTSHNFRKPRWSHR